MALELETASPHSAQYFVVSPGGNLTGEVTVPGDKSISHRAAILAALSYGESEIEGFLDAKDTFATVTALRDMGVMFDHVDSGYWLVHGVGLHGLQAPTGPINCFNSGTSLRLLAGVLCAQPFDSELTGDEALMARPLSHIMEPLIQMGAKISLSEDGCGPIKITGGQKLQGIKYNLPLDSSQVKSSALLAALFAEGTTTLIEPFATRNHTERMLNAFGYKVQMLRPTVCLKGGGELKSTRVQVPGDISTAAYFMVGASITKDSDVLIRNVCINETRIGVINILRIMGAHIIFEREEQLGGELVADIRVTSAQLQGIDIPVEQVPLAMDDFPILFVAAACAKGTTILREAEALRLKGGDRLHTMAAGLRQLGVNLEVRKDGIVIEGSPSLHGGKVRTRGDARVALAFAVAALVSEERIIIEDCAKVADSFPNFLELAHSVGLDISTTS